MSQTNTEYKKLLLKKSKNRYYLSNAMLIIISTLALYLIISLISFSPPGSDWSEATKYKFIHNLGGIKGARISDILFFIFGVVAYVLPLMMLSFCWSIFLKKNQRNYIDFFSLSLKIIGGLVFILTSCCIASLNIDDIYDFSSGGVIGILLNNIIFLWLKSIYINVILLLLWVIGLTLFTGCSWITISEKIGDKILYILTFIFRLYFRNNYKHNHFNYKKSFKNKPEI